jgi:hypothetical protein
MNEETPLETLSQHLEKPSETNGLSAYSPLAPQGTVSIPEVDVSTKPSETYTYRRGTAFVPLKVALHLTQSSKATFHRYTKSGKLGFETNDDGEKIYQIPELERVFGKLAPMEPEETVSKAEEKNQLEPPPQGDNTALEVAILREKLRHAEEIAHLYQQQAEKWQQQAERATLMLSHRPEPMSAAEPPAAQPIAMPAAQPKKKFLGIFGGR